MSCPFLPPSAQELPILFTTHPLFLGLLQAQSPDLMLEGDREQQELVIPASISIQTDVTQRDVISNTCAMFASAGTPHHDVRNNVTLGEVLDNFFVPLPTSVSSSVNVDRLAQLLVSHPDQDSVTYVVDCFRFSFEIG